MHVFSNFAPELYVSVCLKITLISSALLLWPVTCVLFYRYFNFSFTYFRWGRSSVNNQSTGVHSLNVSQGDSITNQFYMGGNGEQRIIFFLVGMSTCENVLRSGKCFAKVATLTICLSGRSHGVFLVRVLHFRNLSTEAFPSRSRVVKREGPGVENSSATQNNTMSVFLKQAVQTRYQKLCTYVWSNFFLVPDQTKTFPN